MMHGREKSDSAIVAGKPTNKAGQPAAEPVEPRAEAKGNASQQSTRRTQSRVSVSHALERIRQSVRKEKLRRQIPKVGAECPNWARSVLCGGRSVMSVPTAIIRGLLFELRCGDDAHVVAVIDGSAGRTFPIADAYSFHLRGGT